VRKLVDWLVALLVLLLGRGRAARAAVQRRGAAGEGRIVPAREPNERAELVAVLLFLCAAGCAVATPLLYAFESPALTQLLGLSIGLAFCFLAAGLIVIGKRVVVTEELVEPYPAPARETDQDEVLQIIDESGDSVSRKGFLKLAGGAAVGSIGIALLTPAASLGPVFDTDPLYRTPWRRGRRLVDENGRRYRADDIESKLFYTGYPEGASHEELGAPLVLVRIDPGELELPQGRDDWAPDGIVAYSKICTHAGCAVSLYRVPTFAPVQPKPALVCPCHYSTFDPAKGASVLFGPAGRPLPQLPLRIDASGGLRAAGNFSGPIGPSWWGVRMGKAR
jgi:quinol---cytochrome c reductase iron-sulfur subunit